MREQMTTWLDMLGLVLIAAGAAAGLHPLIGWASLAAGGAVVLAGSAYAARQTAAARKSGGGEA
ncbi:hypothetical protein [Streptomyces sp. NBC_01237]|uniref:hypothetical protein n=1 Tax=Streptomyces sp. NBC_01237 TaxID=2903790 RepID=UPI002DD980D5|nr:hypothetical protein [Streptomyces sp. NBC_01237]WRZ72880.1 hypothetical protein OG251_15280 [Streptomyces sp. NBC_01237]